jgi:TRAP-type C4-dicarboxylate transport system permease small subunit
VTREAAGSAFDAAQRSLNRWLHVVAGITLAALLFWTVADIVGRTFFAQPLPGTVELTELAVVVLVYLGLPRAENEGAHISADLLYVRLLPRSQAAMRVFAGAVSLVVIAVMTWRLFLFARQMDAGGYTTGVLGIPLFPVAMLGVVGSTAFTVAIAATLAQSIHDFLKETRN